VSLTVSPSLIRLYCKPVASDTTNWSDSVLNGYWDRAHERLKQLLCPPFSEADIEALNNDATDSDSGNDLIARQAALLIFEALPGSGGNAFESLRRDLYGGTLPDQTTQIGLIEQIQTGAASLFDASGTKLARTAVTYHTDAATPYRTFSLTKRDSEGTIVGNTGTLDQFDNQLR
jgi:hypothetical protein